MKCEDIYYTTRFFPPVKKMYLLQLKIFPAEDCSLLKNGKLLGGCGFETISFSNQPVFIFNGRDYKIVYWPNFV
jgi:hypothetical protein